MADNKKEAMKEAMRETIKQQIEVMLITKRESLQQAGYHEAIIEKEIAELKDYLTKMFSIKL